MALPYELQIQQLLQELGHYQAVIRSCRKENHGIWKIFV